MSAAFFKTMQECYEHYQFFLDLWTRKSYYDDEDGIIDCTTVCLIFFFLGCFYFLLKFAPWK